MEAVGVRFQAQDAVGTPDRELVGIVLLEIGNKPLPEFPVAGEDIGGLIPVVEISGDIDVLAGGSAVGEYHAVTARLTKLKSMIALAFWTIFAASSTAADISFIC